MMRYITTVILYILLTLCMIAIANFIKHILYLL